MIITGLLLAWAALCGALARRLAGGLLRTWLGDGAPGTLISRAIGAAVLAWGVLPACWSMDAPVWLPAAAGGLFFLGMASGFPRCGMVPQDAVDVLAISGRHGGFLAVPGAGLCWALGLGWAPLVAAGAAVGWWYWAARLWQPSVPLMGWIKGDPPAWAEPWVGGGVGVAWAVAVLRLG